MTKFNLLKLIFSILICQAAGIIGSFFTTSSISSWYSTINKPSFNPPNWIFGPVWISLYIMMGISLYLVWQKSGLQGISIKKAIIFFGIQLALNSLWSIIFFGAHSPMAAFFEIIVLWVFILLTLLEFQKISSPAGWLLVPYLLWVTFASILNFSIWRLN
jgi:benzodiazapine receptor